MLNQPAFGGMLHQLVSLGALEFRPEPLDALIERRLKDIWQQAPCPNCGECTVQTSEKSPRIWCGNCRYTGTYTLRTPFYNSELTGGEFLIAFVLYADTLLSINQIAPLLDHAYNTIHNGIRRMEAAFERGFSTVWERIGHTIDGSTQVDEAQQVCSGEQGDELTLVAACRDVLRVVSAEEGSKYDENLGPVIEEVGDLSQPLGEVWTDGLQAYREMDFDHRTVVHKERYVSPEGVHINQAEYLFSLVQPWLQKFRGLSKQGLEQAAHTFGIIRS